MPKPRVRVRTLMVAVVVVGLAFGAKRAWDRWHFWMDLAERHDAMALWSLEAPVGPIHCGTFWASLSPEERRAWKSKEEAQALVDRAWRKRQAVRHASLSKRLRLAAWGLSRGSPAALVHESESRMRDWGE